MAKIDLWGYKIITYIKITLDNHISTHSLERPCVRLSICPSITVVCGQGWLELGSWNFIYTISMKNKRTNIFFSFFRRGFFFRQAFEDRRWVPCVRNSSCSFTQIDLKLWRLFVMVCKCAWRFGVIVNSSFVTFLTFGLRHFFGLNTTKVHYRRYRVCATPTVLYQSIWNSKSIPNNFFSNF